MQGTATVARIDSKPDFRSLELEFPAGAAQGVQIGASVAINGTCLTVVAQPSPTVLRFDVIGETLARTNLGRLAEGAPANFERSARVGDEIGGHTVSGHVHTVATIASVQQSEDNRRVEFEVRVGMAALPCQRASCMHGIAAQAVRVPAARKREHTRPPARATA